MQAIFVGIIGVFWAGAFFVSASKGEVGTALMYSGFVIAQIGMVINALH